MNTTKPSDAQNAKKIEYHKESVYGTHKNYYNDPAVARHMLALTGQKTLNDNHIEHLKALGHAVEEVPVPAAQLQTGRQSSSDGYMVGGRGGSLPDDSVTNA